MEVTAPAGEEDAVARGRVEEGRSERCGAEVEAREGGIWVRWVRGDVMKC